MPNSAKSPRGLNPMTQNAAARIQSASAHQGGGHVTKGSFAARAQSAAAKNSGGNNKMGR